MVGFVDADRPPGLWGGYATHLYLGPDSMLLPVPAALDPALATMFNPLGAGIRWAVDLPGTRPGDVVAILGPGVRGLCAAAAANDAGAGFVMVTGRGPRDADRLALAAQFGADLAVDVATDDPARALQGGDRRARRRRRRRHRHGARRVRPGHLARPPRRHRRGRRHPRRVRTLPASTRPHRLQGAAGARRARRRRHGLPSGARHARRRPLSVRRPAAEVVGFDGLEPLVQRMAGEGDGTPPVHAVFAPRGGRS